jgi:hypothetical protein
MKTQFPTLYSGSLFLRLMAICVPLLGAALPGAYAQLTTNNQANVSFGVHYQIHNGNCTSSSVVLDTCVTVAANSLYTLVLGPGEFLLGTKIKCVDCGAGNPYVSSSTSCPESRERFKCGDIRYYVHHVGNVVTIDEQ